MSTIIAGRFDETVQAEQAVAALQTKGFPGDRIASFFVNPAGAHDLSGTHRDPQASAGAHHADVGAIVGALGGTGVGAVAGLITAPVLGPGAALLGAAVGAYVGSFHGALDQLDDPAEAAKKPTEETAETGTRPDEAPSRKAGVLVAVSAATAPEQADAIGVLQAQSAEDIERAEGSISDSDWPDFDPLSPPVLVSASKRRTAPFVG